jgi:hypothetical protein
MSNFECQECDKEFDSETDKLQHEIDEHGDELSGHDKDQKKKKLNKLEEKEKSSKKERNRKIKMAAGAVLGVLVVGFVGFQAANLLSGFAPEVNESIGVGEPVHWHADYRIEVCGEERVVEGGPMISHTHGQTRFHLEGVRERKEQATLGWIMEELSDGEFNSTHVMGQSTCNGEPADLSVTVNGQEIENPEDYILKDGDSVIIVLEQA